MFVLKPRLQDGKKIPKFNTQARMGKFLGFSDEHSSFVARVRNLSKTIVNNQFHVLFDDMFSTIHNDTQIKDTAVQSIFEELFETCRDYFVGKIETPDGADAELDPPPELRANGSLNQNNERRKRVKKTGDRGSKNIVRSKSRSLNS